MTLSSIHRFRFRSSILVLGIAFAAPLCGQEKAQSPAKDSTAIVQGHVRDSAGKPVAGALVNLQSTNGAATETWNSRTDSAGAFRFTGPWSGAYTLRTGESGSSLTIAKSVVLAAGETTKVDLILNSGKDSFSPADNLPSGAKLPQLFDEPKFTVAGVAAPTNSGGHGSDAVLRNSESLVRDTASLEPETEPGKKPAAQSAAQKNSAEDGVLLQEGAEIQAEILRQESGQTANAADEKPQGDLNLDAPARQKRAELYHRLAQIDEKLGNPLEAVHEYQRAAELAPSETNLFDWATELLTHRALEPATEVLARGNTLYPQSARMLIGLGVAAYARGSYERAAQYLASASDLAPNDPAPYLFMGKMQSTDTVPAAGTIERLARFARLAPDNARANYYYAVGLVKSKQAAGLMDDAAMQQVETLLQTAIRIDPKLGAAQLQLGILHADRGDYPAAVAAYRKAIDASPDLEEAHYRLALAYRRTGDAAGAEKEMLLHEQLKKQAAERVERERAEIQEFVVRLRDK